MNQGRRGDHPIDNLALRKAGGSDDLAIGAKFRLAEIECLQLGKDLIERHAAEGALVNVAIDAVFQFDPAKN